MRYSIVIFILITMLGLSGCDKPTNVNGPAMPVAVPGTAAPTGFANTKVIVAFEAMTVTQGKVS